MHWTSLCPLCPKIKNSLLKSPRALSITLFMGGIIFIDAHNTVERGLLSFDLISLLNTRFILAKHGELHSVIITAMSQKLFCIAVQLSPLSRRFTIYVKCGLLWVQWVQYTYIYVYIYIYIPMSWRHHDCVQPWLNYTPFIFHLIHRLLHVLFSWCSNVEYFKFKIPLKNNGQIPLSMHSI